MNVDPGDCPAGAVSAADFDSSASGDQTSALVTGGKRARARVVLTIDATAFDSANGKSPERCVANLTTSGPGGDADASNDSTRLIIDVIDNNDF